MCNGHSAYGYIVAALAVTLTFDIAFFWMDRAYAAGVKCARLTNTISYFMTAISTEYSDFSSSLVEKRKDQKAGTLQCY